jgi:hypothetical protein
VTNDQTRRKRFVVNTNELPDRFPTHLHGNEIWAALGRCVATFGFLEETLCKAIFSFTATKHYEEEEIEAAFEKWIKLLERSLSDPLGALIDKYENALGNHSEATFAGIEELLKDLRALSSVRNAVCHGSWRPPNETGKSCLFYVNRKGERFDTEIDVAWLVQLQAHTVEVACGVVSSVTYLGWQFPGSNGPGSIIMNSSKSRSV